MINQMVHTPEGVRDIYGAELQRKKLVMSKLHTKMASFGYKDIETPTFEFLDIFSEQVGTTPVNELYKLFDKAGNIMALRPDFTPSIARCAAKYFVDDSMPIRLCYEGNSFTNTNELQGKLKESTQMGVELIESKSNAYADAEMVCLIAESLLSIGFNDFNITIGEIDYFKGLCEEAKLSDEQTDKLREYISVKNYFGAEEFLASLSVDEKIIDGILHVSDITSVSELDEVKNKITNSKAIEAISRLKDLYNIVDKAGFSKYISFDLSLISRFNYYTGVIFRTYTYGVGDAIIKGGRYDNLLGKFGKPSSAVGFVFLIDEIMSALNSSKIIDYKDNDSVWVVYNESNAENAFEKATELRKSGKKVAVVQFDNTKTEDDYNEYAKNNGIAEILFIK